MKSLFARVGWLGWVFLVLAVAFVLVFVGPFFRRQRPDGTYELPKVPKALKDKVQQAEERAMVVKAEARVEAEKDVAALEEIRQIDDDQERRKRLAALLRSL